MAATTLEIAGYGYGCGAGYGYGYGDGDGDGYILDAIYADHPRVMEATRDGSSVVLAVWRSGADGRPTNGGQGEPVSPGLLQEVAGPLQICSERALHGTTCPENWKGDRWWVVALFEPVQRDGDKIASLRRLIVDELC